MVALEVSISIFRKDHSVLLKNCGLSKFLLWSLVKLKVPMNSDEEGLWPQILLKDPYIK